MTPRKYKITLDQLRMAARSSKTRKINPCARIMERIANAMEAANYDIRPLHKYVKELEDCYAQAEQEERKKGKASTAYYLAQYLDRQKHKRK